MSNIPTPHIGCDDEKKIASTVLMPGDPLRAKFIADTFLTDVTMFTSVRNIYGYTGYYNGKRISVMASGMGMPSIGIYSFELYSRYNVKNIIRIGSAGAYTDELDIFDVVLVKDAYSESSFAKTAFGYTEDVMKPSEELNEKLHKAAIKTNIPLKEARAHSGDVFYHANEDYQDLVVKKMGCKLVEMESFALFANARYLHKNAACLLTVSDSFVKDSHVSAEERQKSFTNMMKIALELAE